MTLAKWAGMAIRASRGRVSDLAADEDGGATVEWLLAIAAVVGFALPVLVLVSDGSQDGSEAIAVSIADNPPVADADAEPGMLAASEAEAPKLPVTADDERPGADMGIGFAAGEAGKVHSRRFSALDEKPESAPVPVAGVASVSRFYTTESEDGGAPQRGPDVADIVETEAQTTEVAAKANPEPPAMPDVASSECMTPLPEPTGAKFVSLDPELVGIAVTGPGR